MEEQGKIKYETHDLWLAAYLLAEGANLVSVIAKPQDKKLYFVLSHINELLAMVDSFYSRTARTDPRELKSRISDLRDMIRIRKKEIKANGK